MSQRIGVAVFALPVSSVSVVAADYGGAAARGSVDARPWFFSLRHGAVKISARLSGPGWRMECLRTQLERCVPLCVLLPRANGEPLLALIVVDRD